MLKYEEVKRNKDELLALTGLTGKEFKQLLVAFKTQYAKRCNGDTTLEGVKRQRKSGSGPRGVLDTDEQKLFFMLVYLKTYPIQIVLAKLFGLSQPRANQWIHRLLPVVKAALDDLGVMPERDGSAFARRERKHGVAKDYAIDGTERRRQRPKAAEKQVIHYSGKKKQHTDKNILVGDIKTGRVGYLSPTRPGTIHDKQLAEYEQIAYPRQSGLHKDTGFQGYEPRVRKTYQPKKSPEARL